MDVDHITSQLPIYAAILSSTVLILRYLHDNREHSRKRDKEIKDELQKQIKRDIAQEEDSKKLATLNEEVKSFIGEVRLEISSINAAIIGIQQLLRGRKNENQG